MDTIKQITVALAACPGAMPVLLRLPGQPERDLGSLDTHRVAGYPAQVTLFAGGGGTASGRAPVSRVLSHLARADPNGLPLVAFDGGTLALSRVERVPAGIAMVAGAVVAPPRPRFRGRRKPMA